MHLLAFFYFLPKRLMFPQIICATQLDTPCLQQTRKKKMCYDCLFFEKKSVTRRVRRRFHDANIVGVPYKRAQHCCVTLRRSRNNRNVGTCWAKSLTSLKLYATSANKCQHCCGSMQKGRNKSQHCWAQQCLVLLANNVASVCMGLLK